MKKQILFIACSLLINFFVPCKGSEAPKSWQIAHLIGNATEESHKYKVCPSAPSRKIADLLAEPDQQPRPSITNETLASFFQRAQARVNPAEEAPKQEPDLDPCLILIPFNAEAKTLTENMNACTHCLEGSTQQLLHTHSIFEEQVNKVYADYLAEKKKAAICVPSPSYHTLLLRTQRMIEYIRDLPIKGPVYASNKITFKETVVGLLQSLQETKERVNKN